MVQVDEGGNTGGEHMRRGTQEGGTQEGVQADVHAVSHHPNICRVLDYYLDPSPGGHLYMVLEYCANGTASNLFTRCIYTTTLGCNICVFKRCKYFRLQYILRKVG